MVLLARRLADGLRAAPRLARGFAAVPEEAATSASEPQLPPFDYEPPPYTGISKEETYRLRKEHLNPGGTSLQPKLRHAHRR